MPKPPANLLRLPAFLLGLLILTQFSCKKMDTQLRPSSSGDNITLGRFFSGSGVDPLADLLRNRLRREEGATPFVTNYVKWAGYPHWEKAFVSNRSISTNTRDTGRGDTGSIHIVVVPFSKDSSRRTQAILIAIMSPRDTFLRTVYYWQYAQMPYKSPSNIHATAEDLALLFMSFDYTVFGHSWFTITDSSLFRQEHPQTRRRALQITGVTAGRSAGFSMIVCKRTWCTDDDGQVVGCPVGTEGTCNAGHWEDECWPIDLSGNGNYDGPDGGLGGLPSGTSGQGGTGGGWSSNPCRNLAAAGGNPCDGSTSGGWEPVVLPYSQENIAVLASLIRQNPSFFTEPCNYLDQYLNLVNHRATQPIKDRVDSVSQAYLHSNISSLQQYVQHPCYIQEIDDAASAVVNFDYFPIRITTLPTLNGAQMTPQQLFEYFRLHMNEFIDTSIATFYPYHDQVVNEEAIWGSADPLSALLHLNMVENGSVIVSQYYSTTSEVQMIVKTLRTPMDGNHPVSGNRSWGIKPATGGGYLFYTTGVDRVTGVPETVFNTWAERLGLMISGFAKADALWTSLQNKMIQFINAHGGNASMYNQPNYILRPKWSDINLYLQNQISLNELRARIGC